MEINYFDNKKDNYYERHTSTEFINSEGRIPTTGLPVDE